VHFVFGLEHIAIYNKNPLFLGEKKRGKKKKKKKKPPVVRRKEKGVK